METRRGRQKVERGPISDYVAENVAALRKARGLSQQELSGRLSELGRPILPSAISKIESRERGVDVDDLTALAVAFGVNPSRLLLPADAWEQEIAVTPTLSVRAFLAWQWANAFAPLPTRSQEDGYNTDADVEDFQLHALPAETRREQRHPLMLAVSHLAFSARRVIHQATKAPADRNPGVLQSTLGFARRNLQRVSGELDAVEETAVHGER